MKTETIRCRVVMYPPGKVGPSWFVIWDTHDTCPPGGSAFWVEVEAPVGERVVKGAAVDREA